MYHLPCLPPLSGLVGHINVEDSSNVSYCYSWISASTITVKWGHLYNSLLNNLLNSEEKIVVFPGGSVAKNPPANAGDTGDVSSTPWRREWQPTPVFLPENPMDRGAWWATVHGVTKSGTWLSDRAQGEDYNLYSMLHFSLGKQEKKMFFIDDG